MKLKPLYTKIAVVLMAVGAIVSGFLAKEAGLFQGRLSLKDSKSYKDDTQYKTSKSGKDKKSYKNDRQYKYCKAYIDNKATQECSSYKKDAKAYKDCKTYFNQDCTKSYKADPKAYAECKTYQEGKSYQDSKPSTETRTTK